MISKGVIQVKIRKSHDFPNYARQRKGFTTPGGSTRGSDACFEPMFKYLRYRSGGVPFKNNIDNCVLYAFRPGGIVQILKNQNSAETGDQGEPGVVNENYVMYMGESNGAGTRLGYNVIYVPENPGIYSPQLSKSFMTTIGLPRSGATPFCGLVRNDLIAGWQPGSSYLASGYQTIPGIITTDRFRTRTNSYDIQDAPSWTGAQYVCTAFDPQTGANYTLQNSARPRFWRWWAAGSGNGVFQNVVIEDDLALDALMVSNWIAFSWHGGFVLTIYTNFAGPNKTRCETLVCDPTFSYYWLLKYIPDDAWTQAGMADTGTPFTTAPWQVVIDKYGILWLFFNGMTSPYDDAIVTSFSPIGWDIPQIKYIPRNSVSLGCMQTCAAVNPSF